MFRLTLPVAVAATLMSFAQPADALIVTSTTPSSPMVEIDFDVFPVGPISLATIQAAFPTAGIVSLTFELGTGTGSGIYDTDLGAGAALAPNPDGSGDLFIVPELGNYGEPVALEIVLNRRITEFGFQLADREESQLRLFDGATEVGSIETPRPLTPPVTDYFVSDLAFDRIRIEQAVDWVIPLLAFQPGPAPGAAIPLPPAMLLTLAGLGALGGLRRARR